MHIFIENTRSMKTYRKIKNKGKRVRRNLLQKWYQWVQDYGLKCRNIYMQTWTS